MVKTISNFIYIGSLVIMSFAIIIVFGITYSFALVFNKLLFNLLRRITDWIMPLEIVENDDDNPPPKNNILFFPENKQSPNNILFFPKSKRK